MERLRPAPANRFAGESRVGDLAAAEFREGDGEIYLRG